MRVAVGSRVPPVTEETLDNADVDASFEHVRRTRMPKSMRMDRAAEHCNAGLGQRAMHRAAIDVAFAVLADKEPVLGMVDSVVLWQRRQQCRDSGTTRSFAPLPWPA